MRVLVINAGSASLKFGLVDPALPDSELLVGEFFAFTPRGCSLRCGRSSRQSAAGALLEHAAESIAQLVINDFKAPWLRITIAKLSPLAGVKRLGVSIERGKRH